MTYIKTQERQLHALYIAISIASILVLFLLLVAFYPPIMVVALDIAVIAGALLIVTILANIWKHEIEHIEKMFHDINSDKLDETQQKDYESYQILKSTAKNIEMMKNLPSLNKKDKQRLRYLQRQNTFNSIKLVAHAFKWLLKLFIPIKKTNRPTLWNNMKTVFSNPRFLALRITILIWLLFTLLTLTYIIFMPK